MAPVPPTTPCSPPLASRSVARGCALPPRWPAKLDEPGANAAQDCPPQQGPEKERGRYVRRQSRGWPVSPWMVQPLATWTGQWPVGNSMKFASGVLGCMIACQSSFSPVLHQSDSRRCAVTRGSAMDSGQLRLLTEVWAICDLDLFPTRDSSSMNCQSIRKMRPAGQWPFSLVYQWPMDT